MNQNITKKLLLTVLCVVLIAAMALFTTGCSKNNTTNETPNTTQSTEPSIPADVTVETPNTTQSTEPSIPADVTVKGEGKTSFYFNVTNTDGAVTKFLIKTDKKTVGEALLELGIIRCSRSGRPWCP